jgi:hypothetical protein
MIWGKMLHQHKSHSRIDVRRYTGEKSLEGRQASSRSPDADNGKIYGGF